MKALILAAGEGTRLRPLTLTRPKPMLPIGGRPILEHILTQLASVGIRDVAINVHYKPEAITSYFGDGTEFGTRIVYSHEPRLLGSAGAAKALEWFFDEPFVVWYGDVLADVDVSELIHRHARTDALASLALYEVEDKTRCGMIDTHLDGRIYRFVEKPSPDVNCGDLANAGIYVIDPSVLRDVPAGMTVDFGSDVFPRLLADGAPLYGYRIEGYILDIGSPERYAQAEADLQCGRFQSRTLRQLTLSRAGGD